MAVGWYKGDFGQWPSGGGSGGFFIGVGEVEVGEVDGLRGGVVEFYVLFACGRWGEHYFVDNHTAFGYLAKRLHGGGKTWGTATRGGCYGAKWG